MTSVYFDLFLLITIFLGFFGILNTLKSRKFCYIRTPFRILLFFLFGIFLLFLLFYKYLFLLPVDTPFTTSFLMICVLFLFIPIFFAIVRRYFNPPQKLIEQYGFTSAEFLQMNSSYVAPKAVEIAFQQTVVTVLILILSSQFGLGYVEISVCFFILFGLSHLLLYFFMNINLVFLYSSAAIIATFIFPYFVLHVPYGYIHNYIFHWVFYLIAGVSAWVYFGKRKLD